MNSPVLFREVQRFRQWWLWLVIGIGPLTLWLSTYRRFVLGERSGTKPTPDSLLLVLWLLLGIGLPLLFYSARLVTEVRSDGLYLRFFPFHWSFLRFPLDSIKHSEARTYSPIGEYGGWGIRYGWNGKAYNVSGNQGVPTRTQQWQTDPHRHAAPTRFHERATLSPTRHAVLTADLRRRPLPVRIPYSVSCFNSRTRLISRLPCATLDETARTVAFRDYV